MGLFRNMKEMNKTRGMALTQRSAAKTNDPPSVPTTQPAVSMKKPLSVISPFLFLSDSHLIRYQVLFCL